jgi:hypothetical protein
MACGAADLDRWLRQLGNAQRKLDEAMATLSLGEPRSVMRHDTLIRSAQAMENQVPPLPEMNLSETDLVFRL